METTNLTQNTTDPQDAYEQFIKQWEKANAFEQAMRQHMRDLMAELAELVKTHHVSEAFQKVKNEVMPTAMERQGGTMGQLAGSLNVSSAMQAFTTACQNLVNSGKPGDMAKLKNLLVTFYKDISALDPNAKPPLIDQSTKDGILAAIGKICKEFSNGTNTDPSKLDPTTMQNDITHWIDHPSDKYPNKDGQTGQQHLQNLQSAFSQWDNTQAAQAQGLQAQLQFGSSQFNQFMNAYAGTIKDTKSEYQTIINNLKSS
jgi:hypothetical protein